jgi:type VI secretion system protein
MISERTLLERIAEPDTGGRLALDTNRLRRSVLSHLRRLLNARHGHAPAQPDYGIPDLNEFMFSMPESIVPMQKAIQKSIEKYEPRLTKVKVVWAPDEDDPLNIRFEITARIRTDDEEMPISLTTNLGSGGLGIEG